MRRDRKQSEAASLTCSSEAEGVDLALLAQPAFTALAAQHGARLDAQMVTPQPQIAHDRRFSAYHSTRRRCRRPSEG